MIELSTEDSVRIAPAKPRIAHCEPAGARDGCDASRRPPSSSGAMGVVTADDLANFIHDPLAFAARAGAPRPEAFVKAYLQGLEARLSGIVGAPKAAPHRLATLTADTLLEPATNVREGPVTPIGDPADGLDLSPRMGPVIVACAVVSAVTSVVQCTVAVVSCLAKHAAK